VAIPPNISIEKRLGELLIAYLRMEPESRDDLLQHLGKLPQRKTVPRNGEAGIRGMSAYLGSQLYICPNLETDISQQKRKRRDFALEIIPERLAWWMACDFVEMKLADEFDARSVQSAVKARRDWISEDMDTESMEQIVERISSSPKFKYFGAYAIIQRTPSSVAGHAAAASEKRTVSRNVDQQITSMINTLENLLVSQHKRDRC